VVSNGGKTKQELHPGDFAFIPAYTEHKEVNDGDEEAFLVIVRSGKSPITQNLSGWSSA
jgi:quercetin dioxygenase-like cupin family protein